MRGILLDSMAAVFWEGQVQTGYNQDTPGFRGLTLDLLEGILSDSVSH